MEKTKKTAQQPDTRAETRDLDFAGWPLLPTRGRMHGWLPTDLSSSVGETVRSPFDTESERHELHNHSHANVNCLGMPFSVLIKYWWSV